MAVGRSIDQIVNEALESNDLVQIISAIDFVKENIEARDERLAKKCKNKKKIANSANSDIAALIYDDPIEMIETSKQGYEKYLESLEEKKKSL